jgi:hypothetical protein
MRDGLKLHCLKSVCTSRHLPVGVNRKRITGDPFHTTYSNDPKLNDRISQLHTLARQGYDCIQQHIDAYLPAVAYYEQNPSQAAFARQMVLSMPDVPQLGTLPDLGPVIRSMLQGGSGASNWGFILTPLQAALPCLLPLQRKPITNTTSPSPTDPSNPNTHQVALCLLLGLLLGVYPTSVKFPPFHVRVALYRRVHCLLTHGKGTAFCLSHPSLLTLALMEYCAYVLPAYMPVEHTLLAGEGMEGLFMSCPLQFDAFRQEALITGEEEWDALEAYCAPIVERHVRTCKGRNHLPLQKSRQTEQSSLQLVKLSPTELKDLPQLPVIVPYAIHLGDATHCIMGGELRFLSLLHTGLRHEHAVALQRAIHTDPLPSNLTQLQIRALSAHIRTCQRSALSGSVLYACMHCIMGGQQAIHRKNSNKAFPTRGQCKLDLAMDDLICSVCHNSHSILSISALGRIISIKNHQFYLAPCCCTVQPYTANGDEFQVSSAQPTLTCRHKAKRPALKHTKRRCELCSNVALVQPHEAVDHLTAEPHSVYLCQRHTPSEDALRHVVNWSQLQEEIRKRDKPLFYHKRMSSSGRGRGNE